MLVTRPHGDNWLPRHFRDGNGLSDGKANFVLWKVPLIFIEASCNAITHVQDGSLWVAIDSRKKGQRPYR